MNTIYRLSLFILMVTTCIGCDQTAKTLARASLAYSRPVSYFHNVVRFEYAENTGAFLSLGADLPPKLRFILLTIVTSFLMTLVLLFTLNSQSLSTFQLLGLTFITAGGLGNLFDRFFNHGAVIDFVSLGIGTMRTGIFNFADVTIFAGVGIFAVSSFLRKKYTS